MLRLSHLLDAKLAVRELDADAEPGQLPCALARRADPVLLDSSARHEQWGRHSVFACGPIEVLTLREGVLTDSAGAVLARDDESIWQCLERAFAPLGGMAAAAQHGHPGYLPGWFGYVGYEVGRHVERLPGKARRDTALPDLRLGFYDAIGVHDALTGRWSLVYLTPDEGRHGGLTLSAQTLLDVLDEARHLPAPRHVADHAAPRPQALAVGNFSPDQYRQAVRRTIEYIAAGDIFQANLSQRLTVPDAPTPPAIYDILRRRNPAWYAAFLAFNSAGRRCSILSSSPELFLRVRGGHVTTRPIKGTRPRTGDAADDAAARDELLHSPKDNAELAMIIDLMRNDLGRVCRYGSVRVTEPCRLESHPTVFHLVGTVEGELRTEVGPAQLLRATFPGGSITGAPKIRAMEIIDELEGLARGVYTGCIGTVGVDGSCEWNIAIRTIVCEGPLDGAGPTTANVQVGGGIVADSDPAAEYQETLDKARALLEAIEQARTDNRD